MTKMVRLALLQNIIKKFPLTYIQWCNVYDSYKFANGFAQEKPYIIRTHQIKDSQRLGLTKSPLGKINNSKVFPMEMVHIFLHMMT